MIFASRDYPPEPPMVQESKGPKPNTTAASGSEWPSARTIVATSRAVPRQCPLQIAF
ncbi:MAG: hypothetical protein ACRD4F_16070 [Candidatus Angelobacter sp.]